MPTVPDPAPQERFAGRFELRGRSLRSHTARGSVVNAIFVVGVNLLGVIKGFVVAALITAAEYGVWGILLITLMTVVWVKSAAVGDKYIQQDDEDQETAFQRAYTLELLLSMALFVVFLAALPLTALVYGRSELVVPGLVLSTLIPASILSAPIWVFYRRMQFVRQRALQAVEPVVSFAVTVGLAVAGAGYWSFIVGVVAGAWTTALLAFAFSPYPLRLRFERDVAREYVRFSWPLLVAGASSMAIAQGSLLVGEAAVGLAGAGAIALASSITSYAERIDQIITASLYPAICAVANRTDLLFESFVKSNRLALIWSLPFGLGLTLFAPDLVEFALGEEWRAAVIVLQVFGASTAIYQIGFNWHAFFRARGETRPAAIVALVTFVAFCAITVPLTIRSGLEGFAYGMAAMTVVNVAMRTVFLSRLFPTFAMGRHMLRAMAPSVPAVAAVVLARLLYGGERTLGLALSELALYALVTVAATIALERALLREVWSYVRARPRLETV